jgi:hypothetical protein
MLPDGFATLALARLLEHTAAIGEVWLAPLVMIEPAEQCAKYLFHRFPFPVIASQNSSRSSSAVQVGAVI